MNERQNFIYPKIPKKAYRFGNFDFNAPVLREDGDWRPYLVPEELQNKNGIESSACYIEACQHALAIIQEETFGIKDNNYSARFNALLSDGTPYGGDPLAGMESIRKIDGLIPDSMMPFNDDIKSWEEYHSFKGVDESLCRKTGREFLSEWKVNYDIVFERDEAVDTKLMKLKEALNFSPCPISLYGKIDSEGNYIEKPDGVQDTHLALAVAVEGEHIWVFDTYAPFLKRLPYKYNSDFCMRLSISKIEFKKNSIWERLKAWLHKNRLLYREFKIHLIELSKKK